MSTFIILMGWGELWGRLQKADYVSVPLEEREFKLKIKHTDTHTHYISKRKFLSSYWVPGWDQLQRHQVSGQAWDISYAEQSGFLGFL